MSGPAVGDRREVVIVDNLTRTQIVQYAGASGDYNPLHTDEVYVTKVAGYPTVFAHGMLTMGATGKVLTDWFGADELASYSARFIGQVWPGDTLTAIATISAVREDAGRQLAEVDISTRNQQGQEVLSGRAVARIS
jgi:acyl dehydratase